MLMVFCSKNRYSYCKYINTLETKIQETKKKIQTSVSKQISMSFMKHKDTAKMDSGDEFVVQVMLFLLLELAVLLVNNEIQIIVFAERFHSLQCLVFRRVGSDDAFRSVFLDLPSAVLFVIQHAVDCFLFLFLNLVHNLSFIHINFCMIIITKFFSIFNTFRQKFYSIPRMYQG